MMRAAAGRTASSAAATSRRPPSLLHPTLKAAAPRTARSCRQQQRQSSAVCSSAGDSSGSGDLSAAFAAELQSRAAADAAATEREAAKEFDGQTLLALLRKKYGRSYDVSIVQRTYLGKYFCALNVMWKYKEQVSWAYTDEEYMQRLDYIAAAVRAWGMVSVVTAQLTSTKERPRVGKAVSIMLDVAPEKVAEWLSP